MTSQPSTSREETQEINSDDSDSGSSESEDSSDDEWERERLSMRKKIQALTTELEEEAQANKTNKRKLKRKTEELEQAVEVIRKLEGRLEDAKYAITNLEKEKKERSPEVQKSRTATNDQPTNG